MSTQALLQTFLIQLQSLPPTPKQQAIDLVEFLNEKYVLSQSSQLVMTAREELIQAIERSPDNVVRSFLELFRALQIANPLDLSLFLNCDR